VRQSQAPAPDMGALQMPSMSESTDLRMEQQQVMGEEHRAWGQGRLTQGEGEGEVVGFRHWMFWELLLTLQVLQRSASKMQVKYFAILFRLEIS
jgi:hypothetical protein